MSENTLRDTLAEELDKAEQLPEPTPTPEPTTPPQEPTEPAPEEKIGRTAGRARDEHGRLLPGKAIKPETAPIAPAPAAPAAVIEPPSSWKKDYWDAYKQLPPNLATYIKEREEQYIKGVTTYRQEAETSKEIREALAPYAEDFKLVGVTPAQGIVRLADTHRALRNLPPEGKIQLFQRLAMEYGVPISAIQSGQVDPVMQYLTPLQQQIEQLRLQQNSWQEQQKNAEQSTMQSEIENFAAAHEHFEAVRPVMAGLLQSGLAKDLQSAYDKAVRMDESLAQVATQPAVKTTPPAVIQKARSAAVSTKSATPTGTTVSGKKDVRSILEETVEQYLGSARV